MYISLKSYNVSNEEEVNKEPLRFSLFTSSLCPDVCML